MLPVEPINLRGENIDEPTIVPGFDRAEEKAVKSHSEAFHEHQWPPVQSSRWMRHISLLGQARYFDRRFFPALEAFNYLLESGRKSKRPIM